MPRIAQTPYQSHISTLAAALCLTLAACGGGGSSSTSTRTETITDGTGTTTTTTTDSNGNTTTTTTDSKGNVIPTPSGTPVNIALPTNGGAVSATANTANAGIVNDGDTGTTQYWVGSAQNDALTVAFDKTYYISGFTLYTNATNNIDTRLELSNDGKTYTPVSLLGLVVSGSSGIPCSGLDMGGGKIVCALSSMPEARYVRIVVTAAPADVANTRIYELEVSGQ